jgi:ribosomal protein S18 acetylase RimI-like enzyme
VEFYFRPAIERDMDWVRSRLADDLCLSMGMEGYDIPLESYRSMAAAFLSKICYGPAPSAMIVAESSKREMAGLVWVMQTKDENSSVDRAFVLDIHVDERFRGHGLGVQLMGKAEEWGRERGLRSIGLAVSEGNEAAIRLYLKKGYVTQRRVMTKAL